MDKAVVYINGKGGNARESAYYEPLFCDCDVIANSIGAFFAMNALSDKQIKKAYFISPVVNMERLITDIMLWANVTEDDLQDKKEIKTTFGETLSWKYLCYVKENPITWKIPTHILFGEKDNLTSYATISEF